MAAKKKVTKSSAGPEQKPRRRGPKKPYPVYSLEKALGIAFKLKELNGGNPWTPADIANALGFGAKSSDFYYLTAASRDFGLTEGSRDTDTISLTELGRQVAYAPDPETERLKKTEAFHKVDIFGKVLAHYQGADLPDMKYLGNTLQREFSLVPEYHDEFAKLFRENCKYLLINQGDLPDSGQTVPRRSTVVVGESKKSSGLRAFVIMPFVEKNPERPSLFFSEVLKSLLTPAATEAGFNVETANRQGSEVIQSTIINELLSADLVIADMTDHNPNVMFELGLRMAENKPVALVKSADTGRIFDVDNMLRVYEYKPQLWPTTIASDLPDLTAHIKATWDNRESTASYMQILRQRTPAPTSK